MTGGLRHRGFASRPGSAEVWVKAAEAPASQERDAGAFTARLTVDITPALRGRIKIAAFQRGVTVAEMLRALLAREFPPTDGEAP
ncbi:ribbon-helix-helix protein [Methylobacterium aquaticum]|uniref:ribbon-helix-helix protein n=1 Tax=Methylobacterium aquaticum TaxID=270351 RepID=UPI003D16AAF5